MRLSILPVLIFFLACSKDSPKPTGPAAKIAEVETRTPELP